MRSPATLRDDVVLPTPIRFEPFRGRDQALGAMTVAGRSRSNPGSAPPAPFKRDAPGLAF